MGVTTCVILAFTHFGWELHVWDLTFDQLVAGRKVSFAAQALFVPATTLAKLSILTSYLRLAPRDSMFRRMTCKSTWPCTPVTVCWDVWLIRDRSRRSLVHTLDKHRLFYSSLHPVHVSLLQPWLLDAVSSHVTFADRRWLLLHSPLSSYWNLARNESDCVPEAPALLSQAATTAVCDFIVWVLPLPALYRAKLPLAQRLALITLFSFGLIVVLAGCIRTYWIHYVVQETYDVTWYGFQLWMWTAVEVQLGIMCGCVPWLKSLFKFWMSGRRVTDITDKARGECGQQSSTSKGSKGGTVVRMDSLAKIPAYEDRQKKKERPDRDEYSDLERCAALDDPGDPDGILVFTEPLPESAASGHPPAPALSDLSLSTSILNTLPPELSETIQRFPNPPPDTLPANTPGLALAL